MDSRIKFEQTDIFSSSRRKNRTHVSDWPLSLTYNLYLWEVFPHLPSFSPKVRSHLLHLQLSLTTEEHKQTSQLEPLCSESQFLSGSPPKVSPFLPQGKKHTLLCGASQSEEETEKNSRSLVYLLILTPHGVCHTAIWNILVTELV